MKPTPIFSAGDIIRVPFPFVERQRDAVRPALVISSGAIGLEGDLAWTMMITSAANRGWPDDISLEDDYLDYGLKRPSILRVAKISTVEVGAASLVGRLHGPKLAAAWEALRQRLPLPHDL